MNKELPQIFQNDKFGNVRVVLIGKKEHFCASDIARSLGYKRPNDAVSQHCRSTVKHRIATEQGNASEMNFIPEGDVYRLITHSKLPQAEEFEHWVFDEVLPSIRKHGAYMTDNVLEQAIDNPDFAIGLLTKLKEEREAIKHLQLENAQQKQIIGELQPKATYYDLILQSTQLMPISLIAKDYGMGAPTLNKRLHDLGVQYNQGGTWLLYAKYQDKGYTQSKTQTYQKRDGSPGTNLHTQWTQKGRLFIYELMKQQGILPTIEREE